MYFKSGGALVALICLGSGIADAQSAKGGNGGRRSSVRSPASTRPVFKFKSLTAGQRVDPASVGTCRAAEANGVVNCSATDDVIGGVKSMLGLGYSFLDGRFAGLGFTFFTTSGEFQTLGAALTDRYGKACATGTTHYMSPIGLRSEFPTKTWCFKTGKLVLKSYALNASVGSLDYRDSIYPAEVKARPVRDF